MYQNKNFICLEDHALVKHKLTLIRDKNTTSQEFREILEELTFILAVIASENLKILPKNIETPIANYLGGKVEGSLIVPIMRAGLGMINPLLKLLPDTRVGFLGLARDEETLDVKEYYNKIPDVSENSTVFLLDPMLATGGSMCHAVKHFLNKGCKNLIVLSILATPVGLDKIFEVYKDIKIFSTGYDEILNENGYIVPGLGDAGDRIFNT